MDTGDRLYEALCRYEELAEGLEPQTNSGPPAPWAAPGQRERVPVEVPPGDAAKPAARDVAPALPHRARAGATPRRDH